MHRFFPAFALLLLSSCQVYRGQFDCPPGEGVPCTSVTQIESMIVETPHDAPDIFLSYLPSRKARCVKAGSGPTLERKVWIAEKVDASGRLIAGHYIYLSPSGAL